MRGQDARVGFSDLELNAKYRLFRREKQGLSTAAFPRAILHTGSDGSGKVGALVPVWA